MVFDVLGMENAVFVLRAHAKKAPKTPPKARDVSKLGGGCVTLRTDLKALFMLYIYTRARLFESSDGVRSSSILNNSS